jgi:hypothetical protein
MIAHLGITTIGIEAVMALPVEDRSLFATVIMVVDIHLPVNEG